MTRVHASTVVPGPLGEAEALWYDRGRWPNFVDGFSHVVSTEGEWPREGARLIWDSTPHGRGRVVERVTSHEPGRGQTAEVEDERLRGLQRVEFAPAHGGVQVALTLEYGIKNSTPVTPLVDALFVRRAIRDTLRRTLARYARERVADRDLT